MARFGSVAELAAFLGKLDPDYAQHALALWQKGIKTPQQLANFSEPHYLACDVPEGHIDDIEARAGAAGEHLAYSKLFRHHSVKTLSSKQWEPSALKNLLCYIVQQNRGSQTTCMLPCNLAS